MAFFRRMLGVFVMGAGIIGLLLSLGGLIGVIVVRPRLYASLDATLTTLSSAVDTSQKTLVITDQALDAAISSVDTLSSMLSATAQTVADSLPVITQVRDLSGETLPATFTAVEDSLRAAQAAAQSLEGAIRSFESFRSVLGAVPFLSAVVPDAQTSYSPDKPLAVSLGEISASLDEMPDQFMAMSTSFASTDDDLSAVQSDLATMAGSVAQISTSLSQYQAMVKESQTSMENLQSLLTDARSRLPLALTGLTVALGLFFLWLMAAQVGIFSQGLELFHGTAQVMNLGAPPSDSTQLPPAG
jgi:flagellin-like hook-associated protein FlgL